MVIEKVFKNVLYFATFPMRVLYFHGPRLGGYGFQEGVSSESVCEKYTSVRSDFWKGSDDAITECAVIMERKFNAFLVGSVALFVIGMFLQYLHIMSTRYAIYPRLKKIDDDISKLIRTKN